MKSYTIEAIDASDLAIKLREHGYNYDIFDIRTYVFFDRYEAGFRRFCFGPDDIYEDDELCSTIGHILREAFPGKESIYINCGG